MPLDDPYPRGLRQCANRYAPPRAVEARYLSLHPRPLKDGTLSRDDPLGEVRVSLARLHLKDAAGFCVELSKQGSINFSIE